MKKFLVAALSAAVIFFSGCGGIPPKKVAPKPDAPKVETSAAPAPKVETPQTEPPATPKTEVIYKIGVDVPEGRYKLVMSADSYFRIENADGELVMQGADYANPLVLIDGQRLTVWNGDIKFVERYDNPAPKPAPVVETPAPRLTAEEFDARFLDVINSAADAVGAAGMDGLGTPDRRVEGGRDVLIYSLDRDLTMSESTSAGAIKRVELNLTNVTRDNLLMTLIAFDAAARAFSDDADINAIHRALGLGGDLADMIKPHSATLNGIKYAKNVVGKNAMTFSISE